MLGYLAKMYYEINMYVATYCYLHLLGMPGMLLYSVHALCMLNVAQPRVVIMTSIYYVRPLPNVSRTKFSTLKLVQIHVYSTIVYGALPRGNLGGLYLDIKSLTARQCTV